MRWQPEGPGCEECGFDWTCGRDQATAVVAGLGAAAPEADVLRIGLERLLALQLGPVTGVACWDENGLAEARRYHRDIRQR